MKKRRLRLRKKRTAGSSAVEFALVIFPMLLTLLGVTIVGLNLGRSVQAAQVSRDTASMYVRGVDFSIVNNQDVLVRLAQGLGMERTGGEGVLLLSKVTWIPQAKCDAMGLVPCNGNQHVFTQRIVVGNAGLRQSNLGTPAPTSIDPKGLIINYMQEPTAVAVFSQMQLLEGEFAYVVESYFRSPDLDMPGFRTGTGVYSISIF